jgi:hypothetical protein
LNTELANALTFNADFGPSLLDWMLESDGVSNNGFIDDDDEVAPAPGPSVETSSGPDGFKHCPPDVLRCPDGEMVTRQVPNCDFQCSNGSPTLSYLESICTANDCCGTYGLCLSTSKCADASCPNDITLENYDAYMSARDNETRSSDAPVGFAATLTFGALVAMATLI